MNKEQGRLQVDRNNNINDKVGSGPEATAQEWIDDEVCCTNVEWPASSYKYSSDASVTQVTFKMKDEPCSFLNPFELESSGLDESWSSLDPISDSRRQLWESFGCVMLPCMLALGSLTISAAFYPGLLTSPAAMLLVLTIIIFTCISMLFSLCLYKPRSHGQEYPCSSPGSSKSSLAFDQTLAK